MSRLEIVPYNPRLGRAIGSGEVAVWDDATGWRRSSEVKIASGQFAGIKNVDVDAAAAIAYSKLALANSIVSGDIVNGTIVDADVSAAAAIAYSKMANPGGTTTFLRADGTFVVPPAAVAPTHLPGAFAYGLNSVVVANTAYLIAIPNVVTATAISRIAWLLQTVVAGNYDVGIYSSTDDSTFTRLVSKGSTAQPAGSNQNMVSTVASTTLTPVTGTRFYYGIALSTASTIGSGGTAAHLGGFSGQLFTKVTSFPLPASLTGMTTGTLAPAPVLNGMV